MAYDETLAGRVRAAVHDDDRVTERRMFGGLAFLVDGNLAVSASSQGGLLLRVDPAETQALVGESGVTRFEMRGRAMSGWLHVSPAAVGSDDQLRHWVEIGVAYAGSLPPK
jgi:TfoX/Sxy family transcriptional regulator of competence genes